MPTPLLSDQPFLIGQAHIDPLRHRIHIADRATKVEPMVMKVLLCLAQHCGEVVTRTVLLDAVWQGPYVNEEGLTQAVSKLRKALGDQARKPSYIETIPKVGYRLIALVTPLPASPTISDRKALPNRLRRPKKRFSTWMIAASLVVGAFGLGSVATYHFWAPTVVKVVSPKPPQKTKLAKPLRASQTTAPKENGNRP